MLALKRCLLAILSATDLALALSPLWLARKFPADSSVSCTDFVPVGWSRNEARIKFYDNNRTDVPANGPGFHAATLPANATTTITDKLVLANNNDHSTGGTVYSITACNVTSLELVTNRTQSSCSHGGCYHTYYNYVRVSSSSNSSSFFERKCLTTNDRNTSVSGLSFQKCDANPKTKAQFFLATQQVLYSAGYRYITNIGNVDFENLQDFNEVPSEKKRMRRDDAPFYAWAFSRGDNKTIETIHYRYTQDGLSADLVKA